MPHPPSEPVSDPSPAGARPLRKARGRVLPFAALAAAAGLASSALPSVEADVLPRLILPEGFRIGVYASDLNSPRQLAVAPSGAVFVGTRSGRVYALRDGDGDGQAEERASIRGFFAPNGVAVLGGDLYIGEVNRVRALADAERVFFDGLPASFRPVVGGLPDATHHGYRYIRVRDGRLYISLGVPCNICEPPDPELTGTIRSYGLDGSDPVTHAYGVRNSVGFDWDPGTGDLWFTDNGRDWMGDNLPHDELNRVRDDGAHYGFPHCHQGDLEDPEYGGDTCGGFVPPELLTGPHVANLGMRFVTGKMFPEEYRGSVMLALHGSWNRSRKIGYAVHVAFLDGERNVVSYDPFIVGWLLGNQSVAGRPVDIAFLPDGSMLVSDDHAGAIYRVTYGD